MPLRAWKNESAERWSLVSSLRSQNRDLESQLSSALQERDAVRQELDDLRSERKQVRTRIEKLLGQLDLLSST